MFVLWLIAYIVFIFVLWWNVSFYVLYYLYCCRIIIHISYYITLDRLFDTKDLSFINGNVFTPLYIFHWYPRLIALIFQTNGFQNRVRSLY